MADKKATIVIKKITVVSGGAHGGAWKVAFADFMTAMMAFFLVMWLISTQSEQGKKAISDYFSTPSVIEYQFQNYGVELTLEKLFLDLINEPLKTLAAFITPADRSPNVMAMGMKKVVAAYMAEQLGAIATNVEIGADQLVFEIPDTALFFRRSAENTGSFPQVMRRIQSVTQGLEDSTLVITSVVYYDDGYNKDVARRLAEHRADIMRATVQGYLEKENVELTGRFQAKQDMRGNNEDKRPSGFIRFEVKQKETKSDGQKTRKLVDDVFGEQKNESKGIYEDFVKKTSSGKSSKQ